MEICGAVFKTSGASGRAFHSGVAAAGGMQNHAHPTGDGRMGDEVTRKDLQNLQATFDAGIGTNVVEALAKQIDA